MPLTWGIIGAGKISAEFAKAISTLPNDQHRVLAVAAQNLERAQQFADDLQIGTAYGTYAELANDKQIDIAYIGNVNTQHFEVSKLMLASGKHVLCEKPLTLNEADSRELIALAAQKKLFLMEAVWSRCFPVYAKLRSLIDEGAIGEVMYVTAQFGRAFKDVERITSKELGGGTILDLGIYTLQFAQFVYKGLAPLSITTKGTLNGNGVDESTSAMITYKDGKIAIVSTHSRVGLMNEACIAGTKGMIKVPRFWAPDTIITETETFHYALPKVPAIKFRNEYTIGLSYEALEVGRCIEMGLLESPKMTHAETIELAQLMDKMRADVGVVFDGESK
uniref:Trans-1,2-dihydrobenzene-1,2-diol dehydrogenase n=1 Tax=Photinus pyralis TaxID=7054 RepID=A0A1Y1KB79_PHOPY